jgi:putative membrane protein
MAKPSADPAEPKPTVTAPASVTEPLKRSARDVAQSAGAVKQSARELSDSADRTTQLAADRTVLAAERTYAAWVRTGLGALASGVGAKALLHPVLPDWMATITGSVLILFAGFCFVAAVWREWGKYAPPRPDTRRLPRPLILGINGFLVLVALAVLLGVWFGGPVRL